VKKSTTYLIGLAIILAFLGLAYAPSRRAMSPYVSFEEAEKSTTPVQIKGDLLKDETRYDEKSGNLVFYLRNEKGATMKVVYGGSKPGNFDQANQVVAKGTYSGGVFHADTLLVKCPSKYQGEGRGTGRS
jgi:cytochrome c-type biogenesis protein CcmE